MLVTIMIRLVMHLDTSYSLTEMTVQYLLELEWTARAVLSHLNRIVNHTNKYQCRNMSVLQI